MNATICLRRFCLFAVLLFATFFGSAVSHAAPADPGKIQSTLQSFRTDAPVKLNLRDHTSIHGTIHALNSDSVDIIPNRETTPQRVPFTSIVSVRDRSSLGSRFQMGPCIGPVTVAIASPFIVARYLLGR